MFTDPIVLPDQWVVLVASLIPLLSAALVRAKAARGWYVAVAAVLSVAVAAAETLIDGNPDTVETVVVTAATAFVAQLVSYIGVWKPVLNINSRIVPSRGLVGTPLVDLRAAALEDVLLHGEPQDGDSATRVAEARRDLT